MGPFSPQRQQEIATRWRLFVIMMDRTLAGLTSANKHKTPTSFRLVGVLCFPLLLSVTFRRQLFS